MLEGSQSLPQSGEYYILEGKEDLAFHYAQAVVEHSVGLRPVVSKPSLVASSHHKPQHCKPRWLRQRTLQRHVPCSAHCNTVCLQSTNSYTPTYILYLKLSSITIFRSVVL